MHARAPMAASQHLQLRNIISFAPEIEQSNRYVIVAPAWENSVRTPQQRLPAHGNLLERSNLLEIRSRKLDPCMARRSKCEAPLMNVEREGNFITNWTISVDLFNQLQKRKTEPARVKTAIDNFDKCIVDVRNKIDDMINEAKSICTEPQGNKRRRRNNSSHDDRVALLEVCDNIRYIIPTI
ncbi:unnamed protein product [Acanthoscelides obtectus]|uniref:Uncharacterized protein n=1 Tax=Acanthoscelides obtectus TaxID=200917 RepID=A0A9P0Q2T6_ACAOB|nr:unnamed protein product [Acanthoscelides obtectus]CAK1675887.1 hypothetical protein AOBTE_LOCUS30468 [Acanthoscelides obtectus]